MTILIKPYFVLLQEIDYHPPARSAVIPFPTNAEFNDPSHGGAQPANLGRMGIIKRAKELGFHIGARVIRHNHSHFGSTVPEEYIGRVLKYCLDPYTSPRSGRVAEWAPILVEFEQNMDPSTDRYAWTFFPEQLQLVPTLPDTGDSIG